MPKRVSRHAVVQPLDPTIKLIALTQNQNATVDAADYEWLSQWNWHVFLSRSTNSFYAKRNNVVSGKSKAIYMHRAILDAAGSVEVDHRDGDTLNNRRSNLRLATHQENRSNGKRYTCNTSGYKGVYWKPLMKKWQAAINIYGKAVYLGTSNNKDDTARMYDFAAIALHGEFARTNFRY